MGFVEWCDWRFYPGQLPTWDADRYRKLLFGLLVPGMRVLDLGAGRGRLPQMDLRPTGAWVVGADRDREVLENPFLSEAVVLTDPYRLPFPDQSFDAVVTSNVLEHLEDPPHTFREVARLLRPGAPFVSKTPNSQHYVPVIAQLTPTSFHRWVNERRGRPARDTFPTFYRANSIEAIRRLSISVGLAVEDLTTWEGPPNYLRFVPPLYPFGILYERIVNSHVRLSSFGAVLVTVLRRPQSR